MIRSLANLQRKTCSLLRVSATHKGYRKVHDARLRCVMESSQGVQYAEEEIKEEIIEVWSDSYK